MNDSDQPARDRRSTHGVGREELGPAEAHPARISGPTGEERALLVATGDLVGQAGIELADTLRHLDPKQYPSLTLDLRGATTLDPLVIHALLHARERRGDEWGCIRVLVAPGPVDHLLSVPRLQRLFDVVRLDLPNQERVAAQSAQPALDEKTVSGAVQQYHRLLDAARARDLTLFQQLAGEAHPICVAAGAKPEGPAVGPWCEHCPLRREFGGCSPLIAHMLHAAEGGHWDAAQLLVLSLIAEAVATAPSGAPPRDAGDKTP
jgi:hypothetical protein